MPETETTTEHTDTTAQEGQEGQNRSEGTETSHEGQNGQENGQESHEGDPETFPREYVQQLRDESARYRQRAQRADDLAARLHTELVRATGRLADPTDLAFDEAHIDDTDALTAAVDELLTAKPHLAARKVTGDVGQGQAGAGDSVNLAGLLRSRA